MVWRFWLPTPAQEAVAWIQRKISEEMKTTGKMKNI